MLTFPLSCTFSWTVAPQFRRLADKGAGISGFLTDHPQFLIPHANPEANQQRVPERHRNTKAPIFTEQSTR